MCIFVIKSCLSTMSDPSIKNTFTIGQGDSSSAIFLHLSHDPKASCIRAFLENKIMTCREYLFWEKREIGILKMVNVIDTPMCNKKFHFLTNITHNVQQIRNT